MPLGAILILMVAGFCLVLLAMMAWWRLKSRQLREQAGYELQLRLVQSAGGNLAELLQSDAGRTLLPLLQPDARAVAAERSRLQIVQSARWGTVILCASGSVLVAALIMPVNRDLLLAATVAAAAGVGLLLSALIAARISRAAQTDGPATE
jgi:hypothetical protein